MMYIHNSASLRGVCTSYITQLRFVMYDVIFTHLSFAYQLCTNVITLFYIITYLFLLMLSTFSTPGLFYKDYPIIMELKK